MMINLRDKGAEIWERANRPQRVLMAISFIAMAAALPFLGGTFLNTPIADYQSVLVYPIAMFVLMAIGLNIVIGKSGLLDLGYVAFFAIGAYTMGLLGTRTSLNTWEILPIAIITLGFGEIIRIVALNLEVLGRSGGIIGIPTPPPIFGIEYAFDSHRIYYWTLLIIILFAIWMVRRLSVRRAGRAWESIRQDEDAAELMGVPTFKYKVWAFVLGASVGGAAGVFYASKTLFIAPDNFTLQISILILACVVFGGMGNIWGVIAGAVILGYLPDRIRFLSDARLLVFGLVLVIMMNLRPDGLLPRKKREKALPNKDSNKDKS
ncbi:MAG: branched-chain amino acid ABC transporter permease [Actinobacteria bacterium]|nr:branched-chain amino acid ABC transporter permease [Actinomycetota bacterium]